MGFLYQLLIIAFLGFFVSITQASTKSCIEVTKNKQQSFPTAPDDRWAMVQDTYDLLGNDIPLHDLEVVPEGERQAVMDTVRIFHDFYRQQYAENPSLRGVHPKSHGGFRGLMVVREDLQEGDAVGIFQPGKQYDVNIRFSNADPFASQDDSVGDSRGFAMKVLGVDGQKLFEDYPHLQDEPNTQSFNLNTVPQFFSDNALTYRDFMQMALLESDGKTAKAVRRFVPKLLVKNPALAFRVITTFAKITSSSPENLFEAEYFSIAPFQHGNGTFAPVVKYKVESCDDVIHDNVTEGPNFLSQNLQSQLSQNGACLKFMIQDYKAGLHVEDLTRPWKESVSPFRELARIYIPKQDLVASEIVRNWVINPWNTLPEHKPLGGINRTRLTSYLFSIMSRSRTGN